MRDGLRIIDTGWYFLSNFLVAARGDERTLPAAISLVGDRSFAVNTDHPVIPLASRRRALGDNAASAFALDA
jgi:hypothetical protein